MPEGSPRTAGRIAPRVAWRAVSDAPLLGCHLAREAGLLLAWDQSLTVAIYDAWGTRVAANRAPAPFLSARISDDGSRVALLVGGPRLMVLDESLEPLVDRPAVVGAVSLDIDPHGRFVVVGTRQSECQFYTTHGKPIGKFTTRQPLAHLRFVPAAPVLVGASGYGVLAGVLIEATEPGAVLRAEPVWEERLLSNVGRVEVTGDGSMVLLSSYNVGVQRYDDEGHNEGSYHVGGTAIHAVPDFPGRLIAVATQEGEIALLNRAGNVRWKADVGRAPVALELDALGRYLIFGLDTGEIRRLDIEESTAAPRPARPGSAAGGGAAVRAPDWSVSVARNDDEGAGAVLAVLDAPPAAAVITRSNRLRVFGTGGELLHESDELLGVGRIVRTAPGWIAAATDRQILLCEPRRAVSRRVEIDLVELTHLVVRPEQYGLAIVQERDRIGRATAAGRWVWKRELRIPVEEIAVGPLGLTAVSDDAGMLTIYDAAGEPAGRFTADPSEPLLLIESPEGPTTAGVTWVTLARRAQILRGHAPDGRVLWESPTPWEGWQLWSVGGWALVVAPDGRVLAFDSSGHLQAQGGAESSPFIFTVAPDGGAWRLVRRDVHLLCADLSGQVLWRALGEFPVGPVAGGAAGVAAVFGRDLAWFSNRGTGWRG